MHRLACRILASILGLYATMFTNPLPHAIPVVCGFIIMCISFGVIGVAFRTPQERQNTRKWGHTLTKSCSIYIVTANLLTMALALCIGIIMYQLSNDQLGAYVLATLTYFEFIKRIRIRYKIP